MLKSYTGNKILQIMEKTTWILSQQHLVFTTSFSLDLPLVMSDGDPILPQAACWRLPGIYCLRLTPSIVFVVTLHSEVRLKHHRVGQNPYLCGAIVSPQTAVAGWMGKSGVPEQDGCCHMGDDSAPGFQCLLSVLSQELLSPVSPQASLVHCAPPFHKAKGKRLQMKIYVLTL